MTNPMIQYSGHKLPESKPFFRDPKVQVTLHARPNKTWFWRVKVNASVLKQMGEHWCPQKSYLDIDGACEDVAKEVALVAGRIGDHQCDVYGSSFDPSEISALAVSAYRDLCRELEKNHGAAIPRRGLRSDG